MTSTPREIGTLIVVVLTANHLPNKKYIGKQDPYCAITLNGQTRRTKAIKKGGQHPEWDEEIRFQVYEDDENLSQPDKNGTPPPLPPKNNKIKAIKGGMFMKVACYADNAWEPDLIGDGLVDLTEVITKGESDEWYTLVYKDRFAGKVYLEMTLYSKEPEPPKKKKASTLHVSADYIGLGVFVEEGGQSNQNVSGSVIQDHSRRQSDSYSLRPSSSLPRLDLYQAPYENQAMDLPANNFRELGITNGRRRISNNNHTASSKLQGVSTQSNGDFCPQFNDGHDEGHMLSMANPSGEPDQREPYNLTQRDFSQLGMKKTTRISLESLTQYSTPATSQISARSDPGSLSASILLKGLTMYLLSSETVADLQQAILGLAEENPNGLSQETLVEEVMEYLQAELDAIVRSEYNNRRTIFGTPGVYYKKCLRTLRQLSVSYKILPRSLVIHNINQEDRYPVVGGGFADIYHGNMGERRVCLKVLRLVIEENEGTRDKIRKEFCKEALIWRQLKHPNILPLLGVNAELFSPSFCLISPWMENKNILTYLKNNPGHNRHNVLSEVASGLYYLHSRDPPILHGDIRGANILVTDELGCCLADFGLSLIISDSRTLSNASTSGMTKGTIRWMAPELIIPSRPAPNDTSRDVYAFGCTVLEILTLQLPFHDKTTDPAVLFSLMMGDRPARPQNVWYPDAIWDLTTQCWTQEASARPNAQEIYEFFQATLTIPTTD